MVAGIGRTCVSSCLSLFFLLGKLGVVRAGSCDVISRSRVRGWSSLSLSYGQEAGRLVEGGGEGVALESRTLRGAEEVEPRSDIYVASNGAKMNGTGRAYETAGPEELRGTNDVDDGEAKSAFRLAAALQRIVFLFSLQVCFPISRAWVVRLRH